MPNQYTEIGKIMIEWIKWMDNAFWMINAFGLFGRLVDRTLAEEMFKELEQVAIWNDEGLLLLKGIIEEEEDGDRLANFDIFGMK